MVQGTAQRSAARLARLSEELRAAAWEIAVEVVGDGLVDDTIPSLARLGRVGQLGQIPTFVSELARELGDPQPERLRRGSPLALDVRDHAREREALGFSAREIVTELVLLRRVLWRFVAARAEQLDSEDVLLAERRLNETVDGLTTECVVAYFDRATSELARRARRDPLTELLNHRAFQQELTLELERARRYRHGLTLVFLDLDDFKLVNDTFGHLEGDRVLRRVAATLQQMLRGSDLAGRMGGDEFAVLLLESDVETGAHFVERLQEQVDELAASGDLPIDFGLSPGSAHYPVEGTDAETLFRIADERLYAAKRSKR